MNEFFERERMNPWAQFGLLIGLCGAGIIVYALLTAIIAMGVLHASAVNMQEVLSNPANVQTIRFLETLGSFAIMFLPALIFSKIVDTNALSALGFSRVISWKQISFVVILFVACLFAGAALAELNEWIPISKDWATKFKHWEDDYDKQIMIMGYMKNGADFLWSLLVLALMPAIFEETLFRGALQPIMVNITRNAFVGILLTGIIFSAIHGSYYGFLPRVFLGFVLGYIYYFGRNIWLNITMHFLNNAIAVTQMYNLSKSGKLNGDNMQDHFPVYLGIISFVFVIVMLVLLKKESNAMYAKPVVKQEHNTNDVL